MTSYNYRNARIERLNNTLADMDIMAPLDPLARPALEAELAALQTDDWTVTDGAYRAIGADFISVGSLDPPLLKFLVDSDPALTAFGRASAFTELQAMGISQLGESAGAPRADYLDRVRVVVDGDETVLAELLHTGHRRWLALPLAERPYPFDDVGVLLPLRLETLFDAPGTAENPDPERWQLLLRVTPDEASIRRDDAFVSEGEQAALLAFWRAIRVPEFDVGEWWLDGDAAGLAWKQLCDQVRPERAAWLVGEIPARPFGDDMRLALPADMPEGPQPNRVGGLPPELRVYATTTVNVDGLFLHPLGRLPQDEAAILRPEALELRIPKTIDQGRDAWWTSWDKAKEVGLGGQWLLPAGISPQTIEALYVVGIGDEPPDDHFRGQVDAGEMSIMRRGTPTNAVAGKGTGTVTDPSVWRAVARERLRRRLLPAPDPLPPSGLGVQTNLLGPEGGLPFFPGADAADEGRDSQLMVAALWPALWGHWLRDLWDQGDDAYRVGVWMAANFHPEGALPPLRIGDQPYGLLPATALSLWTVGDSFVPEINAQRAVELKMSKALVEMRRVWADLVRPKNSVVGKTTAEFMALLGRDALSRGYLERRFLPAWVLPALYAWDPDRTRDFNIAVEEAHTAALEMFGRMPDPLYLAYGYPRPVHLPLVQPTRMVANLESGERILLQEVIRLLYDWNPNNPDDFDLSIMFEEMLLEALPDSLLLRLLAYACQLAVFWGRTPSGSAPELRVVNGQKDAAFEITAMFDDPAWLSERPNPFRPDPNDRKHRLPTVTIPEERLRDLERALRATLDSAAHRIDPWVTGFAWQRLDVNSRSWRGAHRLGAYGWLDGPFGGAPGPTEAGRLHAPSYNQALAALVLRDKFLSAGRAGALNQNGDSPWQMDITSSKARLAEEMADEVRMGFHIHEILGRRVEHIIGAHQTVKELRTSAAYAMTPERADPNEVCNGEAALRGLLAGDPAFPLSVGQQQELRHLRDALDTYGDLLMADGVMQLVNREIDRAAATMDAAAGFGRPPSFDFLRTPASGYQIESAVVSVLPFVNVTGLAPDAPPGRLADPSVAAFLDARLGTAWAWTAEDANGIALGSVTLDELGLAPVDALALSDEFLCDMARAKLGVPEANISSPRQHALALELVTALGSRPASGRDLVEHPASPLAANAAARVNLEAAIYSDLRERYVRLHTGSGQLVDDLRNAVDDVARSVALRRALAWGLAPATEPADRAGLFAALMGEDPPDGAAPVAALTEKAAAELEARRKAAPDPADVPDVADIALPMPDQAAAHLPDGVSTLARAIANLASPNGRLAILARWSRDELIGGVGIDTTEVAPGLDEEWLTVVAATRAGLARLEALQLEMEPALTGWSSSPHDLWQTSVVLENVNRRRQGITELQMPRFMAAYGPADVWAHGEVAVGLVDAFSEAIPMAERTTMTAFGFNAPSARAPQAILLAAPPASRMRLDADLLRQIVEETRELARARTVRLEDLDQYQSLAPSSWLRANGGLRAYLRPYPLFVAP